MRVGLPFLLSLLFSLGMHVALLMLRLPQTPRVEKPPSLMVELLPPEVPPAPVEPLPDRLSSQELSTQEPQPEPPPQAPPPQTPSRSVSKIASAPPSKPRAEVRQAQAKLMKQLLYPPEAIEQGLEGEVVLLLSLDTEGTITDISLARSSGHSVLDAAAMRAARGLGKLRTSNRQFLLPVEFALE